MYYTSILWDSEDDPDGNVQPIAEHDLGIEDVEWVLGAPDNEGTSKWSQPTKFPKNEGDLSGTQDFSTHHSRSPFD